MAEETDSSALSRKKSCGHERDSGEMSDLYENVVVVVVGSSFCRVCESESVGSARGLSCGDGGHRRQSRGRPLRLLLLLLLLWSMVLRT